MRYKNVRLDIKDFFYSLAWMIKKRSMCEMYKADMYLRPFFFNLSMSRKYHIHDRAGFTYDRQSAFVHYSEQIYTKRLIGSRRSSL